MVKKIETVNLLLERKLITSKQVDLARQETKRTGLTLEKALEKLGFITEEDITSVCADALGVPYMDLTDYLIDQELIKLIPEKLAKKYKIVPLFKIGNNLTLGMVNPQDINALDGIRRVTKIDIIEPTMVSEKGIQRILDSCYGLSAASEIAVSLGKKSVSATKQGNLADIIKKVPDLAEEAPIIKLVNILIMQAARDRASDIHIEPEENTLRVRYRIDGVLREVNNLPKSSQGAIISRIKLLANMDIAETRKPQDGRIRINLDNRNLDIRLSTFPTVHGENVVMRLLDKSSVVLGLKELGFPESQFKAFNKLIRRPHGIILVTGPTGSGKTTTLYSALTSISSMEKNIITIEDPVEYEMPLIRQTPVNPKAGITFANGLRSILRQDPDIIMVGEIRDKETGEVAIQASLTGHLVFSTLHTNDASSTLTRLIDMGVEPFLISTSVIGILAQRLVRRLCEKCKEKYTPTSTVLKDLGIKEKVEFYRAKGCAKCNNIGYLGRVGIFELLEVDEEIRKMVNQRKSADEIAQKAKESGMRSLIDDGLDRAKEGLTTLDEVLMVAEAKE